MQQTAGFAECGRRGAAAGGSRARRRDRHEGPPARQGAGNRKKETQISNLEHEAQRSSRAADTAAQVSAVDPHLLEIEPLAAQDAAADTLRPRRIRRKGALGSVRFAHPPRLAQESDGAAIASLAPFGPGTPSVRDAIFRRLLAAADLTAAIGGIAALALLTGKGLEPPSVATVPMIVLLAKLTGRYDQDEVVLRKSTLDETPALLMLAAAFALTWSLVTVAFNVHSNRAGVILLWSSSAALLVVTRAAARMFGQRLGPKERVLIIGGSTARDMLARRLAISPMAHLEVAGFLPLEDERRRGPVGSGDRRRSKRPGSRDRRLHNRTVEDLAGVVDALAVDRVIVVPTSADPETMLDAIATATAVGVKVSIVPRIFEVVGSAVAFDEVGGMTVLGVKRSGLSRSSRIAKRAMDIVIAAGGLLILAPFGALIALAIRLDTPGPIFFRQPRVGRDGRTFQLVKFRSMVDRAEAQRAELEALNESEGVFKLSRDPRVTRVGRLLRRTSLDELPQLINVLRGEMSLVGPRPLVMDEDRRVAGRHRRRLQLSPGMTGPWQVLGPERPPLAEMVKLDYLYGANWSLWFDLKILLRTVAHVLGGRGV